MNWHKKDNTMVCISNGFVFTIKKGAIGVKRKPVYWVCVNYKSVLIKEYDRFNTLWKAKRFCRRYIKKGLKV